jgi:hypothetical protein
MHKDDNEIVATIGLELPLDGLDGAGSGFGLTSCAFCGRIIDSTCSVCVAPEPAPMAPGEARRRQEELRDKSQREQAWYERGAR